MPIYEYECEACGRRTEVLQGLSEEPRRECENCGGKLRRLISAPAVQFKGTGWYVTDYAGRKSDDASTPESSKEESAKAKEPSTANGSSSASGATTSE